MTKRKLFRILVRDLGKTKAKLILNVGNAMDGVLL